MTDRREIRLFHHTVHNSTLLLYFLKHSLRDVIGETVGAMVQYRVRRALWALHKPEKSYLYVYRTKS